LPTAKAVAIAVLRAALNNKKRNYPIAQVGGLLYLNKV